MQTCMRADVRTGGHAGRQAGMQAWHAGRQACRHGMQAGRQACRQTGRQACMRAGRQACRQACRQAGRRRQTDAGRRRQPQPDAYRRRLTQTGADRRRQAQTDAGRQTHRPTDKPRKSYVLRYVLRFGKCYVFWSLGHIRAHAHTHARTRSHISSIASLHNIKKERRVNLVYQGKMEDLCAWGASSSSSSSDASAGQRFQPHNRTLEVGSFFRVGGGVHDSYTFQCGLVGSFTSPGIDTTMYAMACRFHIYSLNCRYLQLICRYLQLNWRYLQIGLIVDISN